MNRHIASLFFLLLSLPCASYAALHKLIGRIRPSLLQQNIVRRYVSSEDLAAERQKLAELEVQKGWLRDELQRLPLSSCSYSNLSGSAHEDFVRRALEAVQKEIGEAQMRVDSRS